MKKDFAYLKKSQKLMKKFSVKPLLLMKKRKQYSKKDKKKSRPSFLINFLRKIFFAFFSLIILAIIVYVFFLFILPRFFRLNYNRHYVFFYDKNMLYEAKITLVSFLPETDSIIINDLACDDREVELSGRKSLKVSDFCQLLEANKNHLGYQDQLLNSQIFNFIIDELQYSPERVISDKESLVQYILAELSQLNITDQKVRELIELYFFIKNPKVVLERQPVVKDIEELRYLNFTNNQLQDCSVAVINASEVNGLARQISQILENTSIRVVREAGSNEPKLKDSKVYYHHQNRCDLLLMKIKKILPPGIQVETSEEQLQQYRADLVLMLGEDLIF